MMWYSLEAPRRGASNEYNMFLWRNKKKTYQHFLVKKSALYGVMWVDESF